MSLHLRLLGVKRGGSEGKKYPVGTSLSFFSFFLKKRRLKIFFLGVWADCIFVKYDIRMTDLQGFGILKASVTKVHSLNRCLRSKAFEGGPLVSCE